jgi:hypothetical protein
VSSILIQQQLKYEIINNSLKEDRNTYEFLVKDLVANVTLSPNEASDLPKYVQAPVATRDDILTFINHKTTARSFRRICRGVTSTTIQSNDSPTVSAQRDHMTAASSAVLVTISGTQHRSPAGANSTTIVTADHHNDNEEGSHPNAVSYEHFREFLSNIACPFCFTS